MFSARVRTWDTTSYFSDQVAWGSILLRNEIPYTAKLSSGKTFAVGIEMNVHGKTFAVAASFNKNVYC